ncbi:Cyclin-dependent kinase G-2 (CDKG [Durusdinium trenchii]|uniref:Cyclin-dependent kinase 2 homolog n=1 Tax=Durusdinium trenchii TaxID=1381693 RepID=A0ABP0RR99_9DINO
MEFCQASLLELIHSPKHDLSFSEIKYIIRQVLDATGCLHRRGILHRDLATKNVLFNLSGEIKVCDFGISRVGFGEDDDLGFISAKALEPPNMIVSLPYRLKSTVSALFGDTEETKYGPKLDIWSVGCILAEILLCQTGRRQPFFGGSLENPNKNPTMYVEEIFQIMGKPTDETWPGLHKLPLLKSYNTGKISSAKSHKEQGDERVFLRRFFRSQDGKPADTKYCLTESFFELLAGLLSSGGPAHVTVSAEHLDDDKKAKAEEDETKKLLKQLSREEMGAGGEFMAAVWKFVSIFPEKALMKCHEISLILMNLHRQ